MTTEEYLVNMAEDLHRKKRRLQYETNWKKRADLEAEIPIMSAALEKLRELFCVPEEARASGQEIIRTPEGWLYKANPEDNDERN